MSALNINELNFTEVTSKHTHHKGLEATTELSDGRMFIFADYEEMTVCFDVDDNAFFTTQRENDWPVFDELFGRENWQRFHNNLRAAA